MPKKVFVSGCYDLLHSGHVEFFRQAAQYGDLYVGIGSDATIPRQAEWEAYVSQFQGCSANARSDEKWQPMERMFRLY